MLIVAQGKSEVINLNGVEKVFVEPEVACFNAGWNIFARGASGKNITLGRYENEKRAKDVLQEIVATYKTAAVQVDMFNYIIRADSSIVYEMPSA